jgi:hypothetical protein
MADIPDYKAFIEHYFFIKNKTGELVPFRFNDVQEKFFNNLESDYPTMQGIRENVLKSRQFGLSSIITALFAVDFILGEKGDIPVTDSDVYSYKDDETLAHLTRFNLFINSFLIVDKGGTIDDMYDQKAIEYWRKKFLKVDKGGHLEGRLKGSKYSSQTASAKVSGRGGTKQNIHWSEVAFYPNTEILSAKLLVTGAEEQVPDQAGKIFRETTGNMMGDFFATEYYAGKNHEETDFKSRFYPWYDHAAYARVIKDEQWSPPSYYDKAIQDGLATPQQCYWHFIKTKGLKDKVKLRENPTYDYEAFLLSGSGFFDEDSLIYHMNRVRKPEKISQYIQALDAQRVGV